MTASYDRIGEGYAAQRRPDPRIAAAFWAALGPARTVVNVGAGAGSYEPRDRQVTAVEPSATMIAHRLADAAPCVQASAEALPFPDQSFDAAMAVLTVHHWRDQARGLAEMRRVARGPVVILTFDPHAQPCWLAEYLPQLPALDRQQMPPMDFYAAHLGPVAITPVPVPGDCLDGFLYAWWRRPEAYLSPTVRAGSSSFWKIDGIEEGLTQLAADLASGQWHARHGHLLAQDALDCGYRLVVSKGPTGA